MLELFYNFYFILSKFIKLRIEFRMSLENELNVFFINLRIQNILILPFLICYIEPYN